MVMDVVSENLPLILGVGALALLVIGLALALRTESGRAALAAAAVRLAVAFLGFAERWLGKQIAPASPGVVAEARGNLRRWLLARSETGQSEAGR